MYKFKLALKFFLKRRISLIAVAAIALCVFIIIVVMTVINGLVVEFKDKNHNYIGDCVVQSGSLVGFAYYEDFLKILEQQDFIAAFSPVIRCYGLLSQPGSDNSFGVEITGLDPVAQSRVTNFAQTLYYHKDDPANAFRQNHEPDIPGCIVGIDKISDRDRDGNYYHSPQPMRFELILSCFPLTAKGALANLGTDIVNTKTFMYSDDSHSELVKVDAQMIYIPFDYAQALCGMSEEPKRISDIHIKFKYGVALQSGTEKVFKLWQKFKADNHAKPLAYLLENVNVQGWKENQRDTISAMEKEQTMLSLLFIMLAIITVFIVFVIFYMIISHKSKDIGILKSFGVSNTAVFQIFITFSIFVAVIGSAV